MLLFIKFCQKFKGCHVKPFVKLPISSSLTLFIEMSVSKQILSISLSLCQRPTRLTCSLFRKKNLVGLQSLDWLGRVHFSTAMFIFSFFFCSYWQWNTITVQSWRYIPGSSLQCSPPTPHRRNPRLITLRSSLHHPWGSSVEWLLLKTIWLVTHGEAWTFLSNHKGPFNALSFHFSKWRLWTTCCDSEIVVMITFFTEEFRF